MTKPVEDPGTYPSVAVDEEETATALSFTVTGAINSIGVDLAQRPKGTQSMDIHPFWDSFPNHFCMNFDTAEFSYFALHQS